MLATTKATTSRAVQAARSLAPVARPCSKGFSSSCGVPGRQLTVMTLARSGVADAPTTTPTYEKGVERVNKRPPIYKVLLHNDNYNKREYVVRVLLKVVSKMTADDAKVVMEEAHETGVALVVACAQDEAETYCENLRVNGLTSTLEPCC